MGIGTAYGLAQRRISAGSNLAIAGIALGLTYAAMEFGKALEVLLPVQIANSIGAGILVLVGGWIYWEDGIKRVFIKLWQKLWQRQWYRSRLRQQQLLQADDQICHQTDDHLQRSSPPGGKIAQRIGVQETCVLGLSLALNAMAGGLGAGLSGHNPLYTSFAVAVFSYLTVDMGQAIAGTYLSKYLGDTAPKMAGVLLVGIGLYELFN